MNSTSQVRSSKRSTKPVERYDPSKDPPQPTTSQRPLPLKKAKARKKALENGSVLEDIRAASIPVEFYEEIEAQFPEEFYAGDDNSRVPLYKPTMEELKDPEKLIKHGVAMAQAADVAFVKMRMPPEYVKKLRATDGYPYFYPLMLNAVREKIRVFDSDGDPGAFVRETEFYDTYLPREFTFPQEINKVPEKIRPKKVTGSPFDPALQSWRDCEKDFWADIPKTHNRKVLYAPEVDGSLYPMSFDPFNLNGMIGCLEDAFRSQGNIPGIFTSVVYFGHARSCFPFHTEDFELLSLNFHHLGAPKLWYGLAPSQKDLTYATFKKLYSLYFDRCPQEPRHKRLFTLPKLLKESGLRVVKTMQRAGDLIITAPYGWHAGVSFGLNVTEAGNNAYKDINQSIFEEVHKEKLYCRCGFNTTGVILDYEVFGVSGHVNSIVKLREENANMRLRITELERIVRTGEAGSSHDGRAPSATTSAQDLGEFEPDYDFESPDFDLSDYHTPTSRSETGRPSRSIRVKRRRVNAVDSDEDSDDARLSAANSFKAALVEGYDDSDADDGRVPFGPSKTGKRGRNPFTQAEEDAVLSWLIYDQIYDKVTQTFTDAYRELPKRMRPTGKGYWEQRAGTDALKNRKEDSLRSYFRKHFPQAPRD